jgi:SAM-dependent methyltransferase
MLPKLYHAHHTRQMEDLQFWSVLAKEAGGPVLELGCGTGRIMLPLLEQGFDVTGVDRDRPMLEFLVSSLGEYANQAKILQADFRDLPFTGGYRLAFLPCNTYSSLDEASRRKTLDSVRRALDEGAVFAVSIPNPDVLRALPRLSELEEEEQFYLEDGAVTVSSGWERKKEILTFHWAYDWMQPDGRLERFTVQAGHFIVPIEKLVAELQAVFPKVEIFGGYDRYDLLSESEIFVLLASG